MLREDATAVDVFVSYSHRDKELRGELETHLAALRRQGLVRVWYDGKISPGIDWGEEIRHQLDTARIVLLLVSPDFIASDYCWDIEIRAALEKRKAGEARVIPVILRPSDWHSLRLGELQALPREGKAVTLWPNRDEAFLEVARGIRKVIEELRSEPQNSEAEPQYMNEATRELSQALDAAYRERAELLTSGGDTKDLNSTIIGLKRQLREGPQLQAGDFLLDGRFKLLEPIGQGGFARVWKAYDTKRREMVAVKSLHSQYSDDKTRRDRFFRGSKHMARFHHPGIVRLIEERCEDGGHHFFVMEYLAGGDLQQAVRLGRISREEGLWIVGEVGAALQYAHEQGVIHRDVKPANVLLDFHGRPKLTDFDLVRAADTTGGTRTGMLGTFLYAAPEAMAAAGQASVPADVFGLGMTALFVIYGADLPPDILWEPSEFLARLDVNEATRAVLERSMARKPAARWASIVDFCEALREAAKEIMRQPEPVVSLESPTRVGAVKPAAKPTSAASKPMMAPPPPYLEDRSRMNVIEPAQEPSAAEERANEPAPLPPDINRPRLEVLEPTVMAEAYWKMSSTPGELVNERDGSEFVYVPAGEYLLGAEDIDSDSKPVHRVTLSSFWIGKYAVTNAQYSLFLAANPRHPKPRYWSAKRFNEPQQPVVGVSWIDAMAYSAWAGLGLPTEAQWEAAARGNDQRRYPWGNEEPAADRAKFGDKFEKGGPALVGSYPRGAGPFGTLDQAGNVWEWCSDRFDAGAYRERDGMHNPYQPGSDRDESVLRVVRGGSWSVPAWRLRAEVRLAFPAVGRVQVFGFRVMAKDTNLLQAAVGDAHPRLLMIPKS